MISLEKPWFQWGHSEVVIIYPVYTSMCYSRDVNYHMWYHMDVYIYICVYIYIHTCIALSICTHMDSYGLCAVCVCGWYTIFVCMYVYIYIYIYIHIES